MEASCCNPAAALKYIPAEAVNYSAGSSVSLRTPLKLQSNVAPSPLLFKKITPENMKEVWQYLKDEKGRTTDFSYGGILMWVDFFKYEYCIYRDTLFIKGRVENHRDLPAYSLPVGKLPLGAAIEALKLHCRLSGESLELSAVPEYAMEEIQALNPALVEPLEDWSDYLYDAVNLSTLKGKKFNKKRNHVNQFTARYPEWQLIDLTPENASMAMKIMDEFDLEGDSTPMAIAERELSRYLIDRIAEGDTNLIGAILTDGHEGGAFTIADIKGDTLFIHVEKALKRFTGSYEMINQVFAAHVMETHPEIAYINREDDAGDEGLRHAKQSYHPVEMLKKYNVKF